MGGNFMDPFFQGQADQRSIMMYGDQRRRAEEELAMERQAQEAELAQKAMMQNALASVLMPGYGGGRGVAPAPMGAPGASQGGGNALSGWGPDAWREKVGSPAFIVNPGVNLDGINPDLLGALNEVATEHPDWGISLNSGFRSREKQEDIYSRRGQPGIYTPAKPGTSPHEFGRAFDFSAKVPHKTVYDELAKKVQQRGLTPSGFMPNDPVHFGIRPTTGGMGGGQAHGNALSQPTGGLQGDKLNQLAGIMMMGGEYGPAASLMSMAQAQQNQQNRNRFQSVTNPETGQMMTFDPVTGQYGGGAPAQTGSAGPSGPAQVGVSADDPQTYLGTDPNGKPVLDYDGLNKLTGNRGNRIRELAMKAHDDRMKEYLRVSNQTKAPFELEQDLRKEYVAQIKDFETVANSYRTISAASKNPDAVGDLSLIFAYMKMLDPGSVVRESEYATAENARGVPESVRNMWNKILAGEKLAPEQRRSFVDRAKELYQGRLIPHKERTVKYKRLAKQYGLNPDNIIAFDPALTDEEINSGAAPTTSGPVDPAAMDRVNQMLYGIPPMDMVSPRRQ